jgi:pyruvate, water dikinase
MAAAGEHTRPLARLRGADEPSFGGKSTGLGELLAAGIPVPPGFAIMAGASKDVLDEVRARYGELGDQVPVAVRSSAVGEDSSEATFAGQYESYLWVRGADAVCDAVRKCWASASSERAAAYRGRIGGGQVAMGVVVQTMVDAAVSGVMFTCNPLSGDPSMVAINASWGLGLAVVGGEVTPDDFLVSKVTREVVRQTVGEKLVQYVPGDTGTTLVDVPADRQSVACLQADAIFALIDLARKIERHFGCHQDIEWAIDAQGELSVLQSRPVTGIAKAQTKPVPKSAIAMVMSSFGAGDAAQ